MHGIEKHQGRGLAVYSRIGAWHRLGTVVPGELTAAEAIDHARLGHWDVRVGPERTVVRNHPVTRAPQVIARDVPGTFAPVQNETAFAWFSGLLEEGLPVDSAGSLHGGRQPWMLFRMPQTIDIGRVDKVQPYLAALHCHDGSRGLIALLTGIRIVCANTQAMALAQPTPRFEVPLLSDGIPGATAPRVLAQADEAAAEFQRQATEWLNHPVSWQQLAEAARRLAPLWGGPAGPRPRDSMLAVQRRLMQLALDAPTQRNIRGTAWGVLQAAWELDEHFTRPSEGRLVDIALGGSRRRRIAAVVAQTVNLPLPRSGHAEAPDNWFTNSRAAARRPAAPRARWSSQPDAEAPPALLSRV